MWKIRVSAAHRSAKQKECVLLIESNTTVGDLLGMVMNGLQVRRNHRICMISKKLHNDEIEFDVSKTVADVGIKDLDAITVTIVSEEPSRQSQRLTKSQKEEHVQRMRAYAAAQEALARGPKKKAATAKKGKVTAGKQGPKKKEATARKRKMAAATAAKQGATMMDVKGGGTKAIDREIVEQVVRNQKRDEQTIGFLRQFQGGHYSDACAFELFWRNVEDESRCILVCVQYGDYAINEGAENMYRLGTGNAADDHCGIFTITLEPRVKELFNGRKFGKTASLCTDVQTAKDGLTEMHQHAVEQKDWSALQPEMLLENQPTVFWSVVYLANKVKNQSTSDVGKSLAGRFSEMLSILLPELDWKHILHGDADKTRVKTESIKCSEYKEVLKNHGMDPWHY
jgi:hypothetical protein